MITAKDFTAVAIERLNRYTTQSPSLYYEAHKINVYGMGDYDMSRVPGIDGYSSCSFSNIRSLSVSLIFADGTEIVLEAYENTSQGDGTQYKKEESRSIREQIVEVEEKRNENSVAIETIEFDGGEETIITTLWKR